MESILKDLQGVDVIADKILIYGKMAIGKMHIQTNKETQVWQSRVQFGTFKLQKHHIAWFSSFLSSVAVTEII